MLEAMNHYLDHASTSFPKPALVSARMAECLAHFGVNPGRSGNKLNRRAESVLTNTRLLLSRYFPSVSPENVFLTQNATMGLNMVLQGFLKDNDHVVTTNFEHNSVLRPLAYLHQKRSVRVSTVFSDAKGNFNLDDFRQAIQRETKLVVVNHASNVLGILIPLAEIIAIAKSKGVKVLVDASQTLGCVSLAECEADFIVFTGHKSLCGPPGTGGVAIRCPELVDPFLLGGTGSQSHSLYQPGSGHEKFESGTLNYAGISGLEAALEWKSQRSQAAELHRQRELLAFAWERLLAIDEVVCYGDFNLESKVPVLAFNVQSVLPNDVAKFLDEECNIQVRPGLQCAPLVHQAIGTFPQGTIRISLGHTTERSNIDALISAVESYVHNLRARRFMIKKSIEKKVMHV